MCNVTLLALLFVEQLKSSVTCQVATVTEPGAGSTVSAVRPVVAWQAVTGATQYRVEIEIRIPEGRSIVSLDAQLNATTFQLPEWLSHSRAVVKLRVTTGCEPDAGNVLRETPASFVIDTSPLCPGPVRIDLRESSRSIDWTSTRNAARYDVTLLRPDGTQVAKGQTQRPEFAVPPGDGPLIAVVRPYCATGFGPYASALISTGKP